MKKFLLGAAGLLAIGMGPALAADMAVKAAPPPVVAPIYSWAGLYIGGNGGWGSSHKCWDVTNFRTPIAPFREGCHDATGGTIGGQIGYRWQAGNWVFGLEAQGNWADFNGSNVSIFVPRWTNNSKIEAFGLFTGQVGYAWNNVLWYVKGGAAVTDDAYRGTVSPTFPLASTVFDDVRETRWGGVVGTGSNLDSPRIGHLRSSMITCSWVTATSPSYREAFWLTSGPAAYSAPTRSGRTLT